MLLKKTKYSTKYWLNNYLSNFDLLYKYKLKTIYRLPRIEQIILSLPFSKISYLEGNKKYINSVNAQKILFFYIFSLFLLKPFIKSKSLPAIQKNLKNNENDYSLVLTFITEDQINSFLFFYFIEVWLELKKNGYKFYWKKPFFLINKKLIELNLKIPLAICNNFNNFFNPINSHQLIKEESTFFTNLKFINLTNLNKQKCIKNLPFFWKNN